VPADVKTLVEETVANIISEALVVEVDVSDATGN
jgi:hypothetical protein